MTKMYYIPKYNEMMYVVHKNGKDVVQYRNGFTKGHKSVLKKGPEAFGYVLLSLEGVVGGTKKLDIK